MKLPKFYKVKTLFSGSVINKVGTYIAVPEKGYKGNPIIAEYEGNKMIIKNWLKADAFRRFPDKWGRGTYALGYFKWVPDEEECT